MCPTRNVEICKEFAGNSDVLQLRHELTIKAAHSFTSEEARLFLLEVIVDLAQDGQQICLGSLVFLQKHEFKFAEHILDFCGHLREKEQKIKKVAKSIVDGENAE